MAWGVRACTRRDCARLREMVRDWVTLEPGPEPERELPSEEALCRELLEGQPPPVVLVAVGPPGGALGGFAVASWGFSTWRGPDLRLGELWVPPPLRGQGIEELLLRKVAQVAVAGGGSQLRVEAPGPWTPPLPPLPGVTDLARAEGWRPVTFGGATMARLGGTQPPGGAP
ncbi:thialysine N-epsilon-acetyltransferase-like isoform X1 [Buteo buteo]|uniref:thialysine N-epsilon-acetyltransferase-like isoform X1 n=1 Tax=Buteo buteo TaxID=30397 RepID=UPI003EBC6E40